MTLKNFQLIHESAIRRKGGEANLNQLMGTYNHINLQQLSDEQALACLAKCVFQAGFSWRVIEQKWPGFIKAFWEFNPKKLVLMSPDQVDRLCQDTRIVRNRQKIQATLQNAQWVNEIHDQHGGFGAMLSEWPLTELGELYIFLKKHGTRLGGATGPRALRYMGMDNFIMTRDVVGCLRDAGVELSQSGQSNSDLRKAQAAFNHWHNETGFAYEQLSKIAALSYGDNRY